jgi:DNA-binding beta-propeller fold protein YncE
MAAWHNSRIRRIDMDTMELADVAGTGGRAYVGDEGPAAMAVLDLPAGVDVAPDGDIVFVDQANQVIRRIDSETGTISRIAGRCLTVECGAGETPTQCGMNSGKSYCGTNPMACGLPCLPGYAGDDGPALDARFNMPFGQSADPAGRLAIADDGTIYFADTRNHRIRVITTDGNIATYAGTGTAGYSGDGGPADAAQLDNPVDVELASDGTLYIADTFNSCIRAIGTDGTIRTVVGICGQRGFSGDGGDPLEAELDRPYGVELDEATGALYVTDTHNSRIRVVLPAE